jgi:hypothetical protein
MSKKHFIALAKALAAHRNEISDNAFKSLVDDIADVCRQTNSNFDRQRFIDACSN